MSESFCPAYSRGQLEGQSIYVYWPDSLTYPASSIEHKDREPDADEPFRDFLYEINSV